MNEVRRRSRFVTVLGWFAIVAAIFGVPVRAFECWSLFKIMGTEDGRAAVMGTLTPEASSLQRFFVENAHIVSLLTFIGGLLIFIVGIGLVMRRKWALPVGVIILLLGFFRQGSALILALNDKMPQLNAEQLALVKPWLVGGYIVSIVWFMLLFWYFSRPSTRTEFS